MSRSWLSVEEDIQGCAQDAFCAALKADQPAEMPLGSKRPCRIAPELSAGSDIKMAVERTHWSPTLSQYKS